MKKKNNYFLVRAWNSYEYFDRCVESILSQNNNDYKILFIDDCSDLSSSQKAHVRSKLKGHIVQFNQERKYSLRNAYEAIHTYTENDQSRVLNVDGDDWLIRNDALDIIEKTYRETNCMLTYGNSLYFNPGEPLHELQAQHSSSQLNTRYPESVEIDKSYRRQYFRPLHLRTWNVGIFKKIEKRSFLHLDESWIRFCEDQAIFFPLLEMAGGKYSVISTPLYAYNLETPHSDQKLHLSQRLADELCILKGKPYERL